MATLLHRERLLTDRRADDPGAAQDDIQVVAHCPTRAELATCFVVDWAPSAAESSVGRALRDELAALEARVVAMGRCVIDQLQQANEALATSNATGAAAVAAADEAIDAAHAEIEHRVVDVIALHQPLAGDLRRLLALSQTALHLERIGDRAVAVADVICHAEGTGPDPRLVVQLTDMGDRVARMVDTVLGALTSRECARCLETAAQDGAVDALHERVFASLLTEAGDGVTRRWSLLSDRVARSYERAGDHAVDIAEAVWFQITGDVRDFRHDR